MKKYKLSFAFLIIMTSCDSYQKQIGESYFIRYVNLRYTMNIGFGTDELSEGLIDPTVFEAHWNDKYILAKTHPKFTENRKLIEYYIIEKVKFGEKRARDYMKGPLSEVKFNQETKKLNLKPSEMESIVYDDLK